MPNARAYVKNIIYDILFGFVKKYSEIDSFIRNTLKYFLNFFSKDQVFPFGKPGAGAPNRTESGRVKTKLAGDTTVRLRAHKDGRPVDYIPMVSISIYSFSLYRKMIDLIYDAAASENF